MTVLTLDYIFFDRMQNVQTSGNTSSAKLATTEKTTMSIGATRRSSSSSSSNSGGKMGKRPGKRPGRKPSKIDEHAKLERSRQSARECRARKKLRYQYLEELVLNREKAVFALRDELETFKQWCLQMDHQGTIPDALVKMIAKENMEAQQRQMRDSQRAIQHQQQQRVQHVSSSSSTSSSSTGASPPQHSQQQQQQQQLQAGSLPQELTSQTPQQQNIPNLSPQTLHHSPPQGASNIVSKAALQPLLRRQMAIDVPSHSIPPHIRQQQQQQSQLQARHPVPVQNLTNPVTISSPSEPTPMYVQQRPQVLMVPGPSHQQSHPTPIQPSPSISQLHADSSSNIAQQSQTQTITRVKSEPPLRYSHSLDNSTPSSYINLSGASDSVSISGQSQTVASRMRSASNPVSMQGLVKHHGQGAGYTSSYSIRTLPTQSQIIPSDNTNQYSQNVMVTSPETFLDISVSAPVQDIRSPEEKALDNFLFQSSMVAPKRTLSDTIIHGNTKRQMFSRTNPSSSLSSSTGSSSMSSTSTPTPSTTASFDPFTTLNNLTTVHCFSATRTSNTPSPAPYSLIPVAGSKSGGITTASPTPGSSSKFQAHPSTTPSSSTTSSPAPLSSLSSLLELSEAASTVPSAVQDSPMEIQTNDQSQGSSHIPFGLQPQDAHCSSTGLSASISEPIPEWYSFLADLHDGGMTLSSRHGASSGQGTPMALTPRPNEQPSTPDPSYMNVPNIIDDLLGDRETDSNQS